MHRLLANPEELLLDEVRPSREAAAHLRSIRLKDGEAIELFDGKGATREYSWRAKRAMLAASGGRIMHAAQGAKTILFACLTKGQRWDWTVQKATELGASRIVPVISERTIVRIAPDERKAKQERWQRIAQEAARQSSAVWLPEIAEPVTFAEALALARETVCFAGALMSPVPPHLLKAVMDEAAKHGAQAEYSIFIGPEGDFSPEELDALLKFARPTTFGEQILRAETAAIYALSVMNAALAN